MGNRPERIRVADCGHAVRLDALGLCEGKPWDPAARCPDCREVQNGPVADDSVIYVLLCRDCEAAGDLRGEIPIPFGSAEARGKWAAAHRDATGHNRWWVKDLPGTLAVTESPKLAHG